MSRPKVIHLMRVRYGSDGLRITPTCDYWQRTVPIEYLEYDNIWEDEILCTTNLLKVTCKKCMKSKIYKEGLSKKELPLFHWRDI